MDHLDGVSKNLFVESFKHTQAFLNYLEMNENFQEIFIRYDLTKSLNEEVENAESLYNKIDKETDDKINLLLAKLKTKISNQEEDINDLISDYYEKNLEKLGNLVTELEGHIYTRNNLQEFEISSSIFTSPKSMLIGLLTAYDHLKDFKFLLHTDLDAAKDHLPHLKKSLLMITIPAENFLEKY